MIQDSNKMVILMIDRVPWILAYICRILKIGKMY